MEQSFWQKRLSRRRLLGATSLAVAGGGAALILPRRFLGRSFPAQAQTGPVIAEDIRHGASELSAGQFQGLEWDTAGAPLLHAAGAYGGVLTSTIVKTSFPVTHVGLHWLGDGVGWDRIDFDLRTSSDGDTWSSWRRLPIEAEPEQNPRRERFATLVWAPGASYVQYRATFPADAPEHPALRNVTITALSAAAPAVLQAAKATKTPTPGKTKTPVPVTPAPTNNAAALPPPFAAGQLISREAWGAPESYRYNPDGSEIWQRMYIPTKKMIVHHTATLTNDNPQDPNYPYPSYTADQVLQDIQSIYYYHAISLGWGDIGYNALIDRFGRVFEGRRGRDSSLNGSGREIISPDVVGGHALQWNEGALGVSCFGNYDVNQLSANEQTNLVGTLVQFLTWASRRHYVWPNGAADFLQVDWVWRTGIPNICGHRDVNQTACPGQYLYAYLPGIRQSVAQGVANIAIIKPSAQLTTFPASNNVDDPSVTFAWKSPDGTPNFAYYLEGWYPNLDTDVETYYSGLTADRRPAWSSFAAATSATVPIPQVGHYCFHVRARDSKSDGAYEDNWTFIAGGAAPSPTPAPGRVVGLPGVTRSN
ncbi:MAG: N-acetylmuramoyl-L-alanine amidase [Dehalococcoidia bacterium]|jgi:hypothetical protein